MWKNRHPEYPIFFFFVDNLKCSFMFLLDYQLSVLHDTESESSKLKINM